MLCRLGRHGLRRYGGAVGAQCHAVAAAAAAASAASSPGTASLRHADGALAPSQLTTSLLAPRCLWTGSSPPSGHPLPPAHADELVVGNDSMSSAGQPPVQVQLVRDFIHDSLYHPTQGYFSKQTATGHAVVGSLQHPMDFRRLAGQTQYLQAVQEQYRLLQASWLTPVEIFQPHYARAIAACILERWQALEVDVSADAGQQSSSSAAAAAEQQAGAAGSAAAAQQQWQQQQRMPPPLRIYEIGGGTGTLALNILDWLRAEHPSAYERCQYSCIEISPVLAARQQRRVAEEGGHGGRFNVRQHDAVDAVAWAEADAAADTAGGTRHARPGSSASQIDQNQEQQRQQPCFIVMCEVLDNLPHDRVVLEEGGGEWQQTLVGSSSTSWEHFEMAVPISDPLITRCLAALEKTGGDINGGSGIANGSSGKEGSSSGGSRSSGVLGSLAQSAARVWRRVMGEGGADVRWLPTGCLQLMDTLHQARPNHMLIAADFDTLPGVSVAGVNAPLVATTAGGTTVDHGSYLVPRGSADIFFPTDFPLLCTLYRQAAAAAAAWDPQSSQPGSASGSETAAAAGPLGPAEGGARVAAEAGELVTSAQHLPTAGFMRAHCPDVGATATASGYNPLLEDYTNSAFFLGSTL